MTTLQKKGKNNINDPDREKSMPISDLVLEVLLKKKPFRHIDHDAEDIITREESIERLYKLTFILAFLLAFLASCLSTLLFIEKALGEPGRVILPNASLNEQTMRMPGILLVYHDGTVVKLALNRNEMVASHFASLLKRKMLQNSDAYIPLEIRFGYSTSPSQETLIFDVDRAHDAKLLHHTGKVTIVPNTKLILPGLQEERYARVGDFVWLFGGLDDDLKKRLINHNFSNGIDLTDHWCQCQLEYQDSLAEQVFPKQSRLWSIKRQKWLVADGPLLTPFNQTLIVNNACAVGLNATSVIFIGGQTTLFRPFQVHLYRFDQKKWFELSDVPLSEFPLDQNVKFFCTPLFTKSYNLSILAMAKEDYTGLQALVQYNITTDKWKYLSSPNIPTGPMITIFNTVYLFPLSYPANPTEIPIAYNLNENLEWIAIYHENISALHFKDTDMADFYITPILL